MRSAADPQNACFIDLGPGAPPAPLKSSFCSEALCPLSGGSLLSACPASGAWRPPLRGPRGQDPTRRLLRGSGEARGGEWPGPHPPRWADGRGPCRSPMTAQPCVGVGTVPPHGLIPKLCGAVDLPPARWRRWVGPKPRAMPPHRRALTKPSALGGVLLPPGEWGRHSGHRAGWLSGLTPGSRWAWGMGVAPGFDSPPLRGALAGIIRCPRSCPNVAEGPEPWHSLRFWHTPGTV